MAIIVKKKTFLTAEMLLMKARFLCLIANKV